MLIKFDDFKTAIDMAVKFSNSNVLVIGIMLAQRDGKTAIVSASSNMALYKEINVISSDEEKAIGDIIFDSKLLGDVITKLTPSSYINVAYKVKNHLKDGYVYLDLSNIDNNSVEFVVDKYYNTLYRGGIYKKIFNHSVHSIKAFKSDDEDCKYYWFTKRFDYDYNMFYYNTGDTRLADTWVLGDLTNVLKKFGSGDDNKTCYVLRSDKRGFIVNRNTVFDINCPDYVANASFDITSTHAKALAEVLSKSGLENIDVFNSEDKKYCSMVASDKTFGVWFELVPFRNVDAMTLVTYTKDTEGNDLQYDDVELLINKLAMLEVIKVCRASFKKDIVEANIAFNSDNANNCLFQIDTDDDGNETSSVSADIQNYVNIIIGDTKDLAFNLYALAHKTDEGDIVHTTMVLSNWESILGICDGDYVRVVIKHINRNTDYFRFDDLSFYEVGEDGKPKVISQCYTVVCTSLY